MAYALIGLAILFFLGHALNRLFIATKIPDVLILVALGYLAGPVFGWLDAKDFGKVGPIVSTMALVIILYEGGLHLSARELFRSSLPALKLAGVAYVLIGIASFAIATLGARQPWYVSMLLALNLGSTASAIVIPMVKHLNIRQSSKAILSLESAFNDVLIIVAVIVFIDSLSAGQFSTAAVVWGMGPKPIIAVVLGGGLGVLWAFIRKRLGQMASMTFASEAWALFVYGILETGGYNGALGVLALGFALANLDLLPLHFRRHLDPAPVSLNEKGLLGDIAFILRTFFFIFLGLQIHFGSSQIVLVAFAITVAIFITRFMSVYLLFKPEQMPRLDALTITAMGPRGLATAVIATLPMQRGLPGGQWLQDVVFATIPMTIIFTALCVSFAERQWFRKYVEMLFEPYLDEVQAAQLPEMTVTGVSMTGITATGTSSRPSEGQTHPGPPRRSDSEQ